MSQYERKTKAVVATPLGEMPMTFDRLRGKVAVEFDLVDDPQPIVAHLRRDKVLTDDENRALDALLDKLAKAGLVEAKFARKQ